MELKRKYDAVDVDQCNCDCAGECLSTPQSFSIIFNCQFTQGRTHSSLIRAHYGHTEATPQVDGRQYQYMAIYTSRAIPIPVPVPAPIEPFVRISIGCKGHIGTVLFRLAHAELPQGNSISIVMRLV
jgi:hypothetical protein